VVIHKRNDGLNEGGAFRSGVPTTLLARTLLDLASFLGPHDLEKTLDSAARGNPGFFLELDEFLSGLGNQGRRGAGELSRLLAIRRGTNPTGSPFETSVLQRVREEGLVTPQLQFPIYDPGGSALKPFAVLDFAWPQYRVAVLPDGPSLHNTHSRFTYDVAQRARLTALGWRYIVLTRPQVNDGVWMAALKTFVPRAQLSLLR
jgi:hypothetical protein